MQCLGGVFTSVVSDTAPGDYVRKTQKKRSHKIIMGNRYVSIVSHNKTTPLAVISSKTVIKPTKQVGMSFENHTGNWVWCWNLIIDILFQKNAISG